MFPLPLVSVLCSCVFQGIFLFLSVSPEVLVPSAHDTAIIPEAENLWGFFLITPAGRVSILLTFLKTQPLALPIFSVILPVFCFTDFYSHHYYSLPSTYFGI